MRTQSRNPTVSHRIFLVEDSPVIRKMMTEALNDLLGDSVIGWAASEREAIEAMRATEWTVALVDLFLREGSGLGVAHAFRTRRADQRLYVVSNYATPSIRERCAAAGVDRVFDKSTELDQLLEALGSSPAS